MKFIPVRNRNILPECDCVEICIDFLDKILPEIDFSVVSALLSVLSDLFRLCFGSCGTVRIFQGAVSGGDKGSAVSSVGEGRY